jgi:hypothetical protein
MNLTDPMGLFVTLAVIIALLSIWLLARLEERPQPRQAHLRIRATRQRDHWDQR